MSNHFRGFVPRDPHAPQNRTPGKPDWHYGDLEYTCGDWQYRIRTEDDEDRRYVDHIALSADEVRVIDFSSRDMLSRADFGMCIALDFPGRKELALIIGDHDAASAPNSARYAQARAALARKVAAE